MIAKDIFTSDGLATLTRYAEPGTLFAFDLDGTLAPIVAEYSDAAIDKPVITVLERLLTLVKVAVITGRSRKSAREILGLEPHLLIGNHGAEWPPDDVNHGSESVGFCLKWREELHDTLLGMQGIEIEFKGESISLHYRKADDQEQAIALIAAAINKLVPSPRIIGGKYVFNVLPMNAFTKGEALKAAMDTLEKKRAIYFGDDVTDEEVFKLSDIDLLGIHIGDGSQTAAEYYLRKQSELLGLLNSVVRTLELQQEEREKANLH